jgi:UDP-N-acetylglucosamine acyltransferase
MVRVHPTSIVDRHAEVADGVCIGPFCHVHAGVRIGAGTQLMSHVVVLGNTTIGVENVFHPFTVIGGEAQIRKAVATSKSPNDGASATDPGGAPAPAGASTYGALEIGDHNVFRESVTVNASSGESKTSIGSHNLFMAGCHVAHDVLVGSRCVVANAVQLAGHVVVEDWVTFGGSAGVAQHLHVGQGAFVAAGAMCERDVPPFVIAQGDRARVRALNVVGLERRGVPPESIAALRRAFARLWGKRSASFEDSLGQLDGSDPWVAVLVEWLRDPSRSLRPAKRTAQRR